MQLLAETHIEGDFDGWNSRNTYRLSNGQVWRQVQAKYRSTHLHRPTVRIWQHGALYYLEVDGLDEIVEVYPLMPTRLHRAR